MEAFHPRYVNSNRVWSVYSDVYSVVECIMMCEINEQDLNLYIETSMNDDGDFSLTLLTILLHHHHHHYYTHTHRPTTCSWVTMSIAANSPWKWSACSFVTRSNIPKISFYCAAITNAPALIAFTAFTMNAVDDFRSKCGNNSVIPLIVYPAVPSLMIRLSACTVDCHRNWVIWNKLPTFNVRVMYPIPDSCVIFSGPIQIQVLRYVSAVNLMDGFVGWMEKVIRRILSLTHTHISTILIYI